MSRSTHVPPESTTAPADSLVIDLNKTQQATVLDANSILHKVQLDAFLHRVQEVVSRVDDFSEKLKAEAQNNHKSIGYTRYHDVITVHGRRGSGKTTFLLSALTLLQDHGKRKAVWRDDKGILKDVCVLEIMDPTLFGLHEHLLLSLLGKIAQKVRAHKLGTGVASCDAASVTCKMESWEKSLASLAKGLKYIGEGRDDLNSPLPQNVGGWEDPEFLMEKGMDSARRGMELERRFHHFLQESLELLGKKAFVLALDDIDTRPAIGWHVLEVLRRYFTSPQLVVILSGDMDLFKKLIEKWQLEIFGLSFTSSKATLQEFKERVDGLTEQYLLKILRTPSRINLGSFQTALQQWSRWFPKASQQVHVGDSTLPLAEVLARFFYPSLACHTPAEQTFFRQTLFANPSRSVVQVLDGLFTQSMDGIAPRLREVFLIPLQNMGFEQPFDLAEALQTPLGVKVLMKQLFTRGYVTRGLDLLPSRSEQSENNGLLALHSELTQAMHHNPAVLFAYMFKACLLRQVLAMQEKDLDAKTYPDIESYLALESQELPSVTASRISALHWGDPRNSERLRNKGLLRLYGASITKNAPTAVRAMYGVTVDEMTMVETAPPPPELAAFRALAETSGLASSFTAMRRWINTPESLGATIVTWQRDLTSLGIVQVRRGDGTYRAFSIFSLLSVMSDVWECGAEGLPDLFAGYAQPIDMPIFSAQTAAARDPGYDSDAEDEGEAEETRRPLSAETQQHKEDFFTALAHWRENNPLTTAALPATLCARVMTRFCRAIERIEDEMPNKKTFVGEYAHRCIVVFLNSVLVEEFLLSSRQSEDAELSVALENPTTKDDVFLKNMADTRAIMKFQPGRGARERLQARLSNDAFTALIEGKSIAVDTLNDAYPLFKAVFSFPLWGLYLKPDENLESNTADTVYGIYMRLTYSKNDVTQGFYTVAYNKADATCPNLFPLLNSFAIPKNPRGQGKTAPNPKNPDGQGKTAPKVDMRTPAGKRLALTLTPKALRARKIADDIVERDPELLRKYYKNGKPMPVEFRDVFKEVLNLYYTNAEQTEGFDFDKQCDKFWNIIRKKAS